MADSKNVFANKGKLFDLSAQAANPAVSDAITFRTEQIGATIYTLSDKAGTLQPQIYFGPDTGDPTLMEDANWKPMGQARNITAGVMDVFTLNQGLMPLRLVFTPSSGGNYTIASFVWGFGG